MAKAKQNFLKTPILQEYNNAVKPACPCIPFSALMQNVFSVLRVRKRDKHLANLYRHC